MLLKHSEGDDDDAGLCGMYSSDANTSGSETESTEYLPTPMKKISYANQDVSAIELGNSVFLCQTGQLQELIDQVNATLPDPSSSTKVHWRL